MYEMISPKSRPMTAPMQKTGVTIPLGTATLAATAVAKNRTTAKADKLMTNDGELQDPWLCAKNYLKI